MPKKKKRKSQYVKLKCRKCDAYPRKLDAYYCSRTKDYYCVMCYHYGNCCTDVPSLEDNKKSKKGGCKGRPCGSSAWYRCRKDNQLRCYEHSHMKSYEFRCCSFENGFSSYDDKPESSFTNGEDPGDRERAGVELASQMSGGCDYRGCKSMKASWWCSRKMAWRCKKHFHVAGTCCRKGESEYESLGTYGGFEPDDWGDGKEERKPEKVLYVTFPNEKQVSHS